MASVAGVDVGSRNTKVVLMRDGQISAFAICDTGFNSADSAQTAMELALSQAGWQLADLAYIIATGYGRVLVPFAREHISEIACHARGAHWYFPEARTVLDIGGQDSKAISCGARGQVVEFAMNDRCAGGTGRFLEVIADLFQLPLLEMGELSLQARGNLTINSTCALFARSEAMAMLKRGIPKSDVIAAIHQILVKRSIKLLQQINLERELVFTGGVCKNAGMVAKLQAGLGFEPLIPPEPLIIGAVGAALYAVDRVARQ